MKTSIFRRSRGLLAAMAFAAILFPGCGSQGGAGFASDSAGLTAEQASDILSQQISLEKVDSESVLARGQAGSQGGRGGPPSEPRSIDGTGNNASELGSAETVFREDISRAYTDGVHSPSGEDRPNPREVSNAVVAQSEDTPDPGNRTAFLWLWGQFLDHDITLTHENGTNDFPIEVPLGDPHFDPFGTGAVSMPFSRSTFADDSGTDPDNPRAQVNSITAFTDASMVYGSDDERASALRTFSDGKLATSSGDLPPFNTGGLDNAGGTSDSLFLCGDVRANENVLLTSIHTLFLREHNRIATEIQARSPELTDEEIYQAARKRVGALVQVVTYEEFVPTLLGRDALPPYTGYRAQVDPGIGILFATAAYRLGHSQVGSLIPRLGADGESIEEGDLVVADAFFNPSLLDEGGIDPLLRGAASNPSQATDPQVIDDLRNLLFGPPGAGGLDLASLNIQRGRDHGMPDYNTIRTHYGLPAVTDFAGITRDADRQANLASVYSSPDQVDPWVGLLSEDALRGSAVGPTLHRILSDQFRRLRDGDRFFYLNDPALRGERDQLKSTRLSDIIERNTDIRGLQSNVFVDSPRPTRPRPPRRHPNRRIPRPSL